MGTMWQPQLWAPGLHTNTSLINYPYNSHVVFTKDKSSDIGPQLKTLQCATPHPCQGPEGSGHFCLVTGTPGSPLALSQW